MPQARTAAVKIAFTITLIQAGSPLFDGNIVEKTWAAANDTEPMIASSRHRRRVANDVSARTAGPAMVPETALMRHSARAIGTGHRRR